MKPPRIVRRAVPEVLPLLPQAHRILQRVYAARGISDAAQLEYRLGALLPPRLGGIGQACDLLEAAIRSGQRIVIAGDFDCDGATGTAVGVRGLRLLGAAHVGYGVPNRATHGYGLSPALVDDLLAQAPQLLVTVDNGIAAHAGVEAAQRHGMRVIVTDHHLPGPTLPRADAIVNPNLGRVQRCAHGDGWCERCAEDVRANDIFPSKALAGVGVMFYLLLALRAQLRASGWFAERGMIEPELSGLLDLVALGTVADLVPLDYNNRILVEAGLRRIRAGRACAGIVALFASGKRECASACAADLGFVVAPRVNAAGRLDDIRRGIECLLADDAGQACELATELARINSQRRELQADMVARAEAVVQKWISQHGAATLPFGVVLYEPDWHHGVVGLVASRLKDLLNRPVIACAPANGNGDAGAAAECDELKASGRSVAGFHLRDALAEIDAAQPGLLRRFGGHAMAAGMSLERSGVAALADAFDAVARRHLSADQLDALLWTDGELAAADFSLELAQALRHAGPWGQGFPEPLFDGEFDVASWRVVGESHLRLKLRCAGRAEPLDAILFDGWRGEAPAARIRAAFALEIDEWSGTQKLRLLMRHSEALA
jgi:single-stranded-DNA-specific exonuclease